MKTYYKFINGKYIPLTDQEVADMQSCTPEMPEPTPEERIAELEKQNTMLQECLLEMSEIIYA